MDTVTTDVQAPADSADAPKTPALPVYKAGEVPEPLMLMTKTQMKERRLKVAAGQEVKGWLRMYRRGHGWGEFELYDPAGAVPMRPLSAKQQAAKTARRTCPACGQVREYVVYQRCTECRRKDDEEAADLRGRTCFSCGRVSTGPLRWTGHGVPAAPRCVPCWFAVALWVQARADAMARWCRSCPECGAQTATDEEAAQAAQALAAGGPWTPRCCPPCVVVVEQRREASEQRMREAAVQAQEARRREVADLVAWAARALEDDRVVVLDTETTGLEDDARIVDIAVVDRHGTVLLDTLVNPGVPIPPGASSIHGITEADVAGAPGFSQVLPELTRVLTGRRCLIYNRPYDVGRLRHEVTLHHLDQTARAAAGEVATSSTLPVDMRQRAVAAARARAGAWIDGLEFEDVMIPYSDWVGDYSDYWGNNVWQPLYGGDHRALGDCRAVLERLREMAKGRGFEFSEGAP